MPAPIQYFHGGPVGRRPGNYLLPPTITKARNCSEYGAAHVHRRDRVYVTPDFNAAILFASGHIKGVVYLCEPEGALVPDPDCNEPGLSFECERAKVVRVIRVDRRTMEAARQVLLSRL